MAIIKDSLGRGWDSAKHPRGKDGRFIRTFRKINMFLSGFNEPWGVGTVDSIGDSDHINVTISAVKPGVDIPNGAHVGGKITVSSKDVTSLNEKASLKDAAKASKLILPKRYEDHRVNPAAKGDDSFAAKVKRRAANWGFSPEQIADVDGLINGDGNRDDHVAGKYILGLFGLSDLRGSSGKPDKDKDSSEFVKLLDGLGVDPNITDDTGDGVSGLGPLIDAYNAKYNKDSDWKDVVPLALTREQENDKTKARIGFRSEKLPTGGTSSVVDGKSGQYILTPTPGGDSSDDLDLTDISVKNGTDKSDVDAQNRASAKIDKDNTPVEPTPEAPIGVDVEQTGKKEATATFTRPVLTTGSGLKKGDKVYNTDSGSPEISPKDVKGEGTKGSTKKTVKNEKWEVTNVQTSKGPTDKPMSHVVTLTSPDGEEKKINFKNEANQQIPEPSFLVASEKSDHELGFDGPDEKADLTPDKPISGEEDVDKYITEIDGAVDDTEINEIIDNVLDDHDKGNLSEKDSRKILNHAAVSLDDPDNSLALKNAKSKFKKNKKATTDVPKTADVPETKSPFKILPVDERGANGDGRDQASGRWGKYGASGVMISADDPKTGERKHLIIQSTPNKQNNGGKWQLPGGALDEKESPEQGAARETNEELKVPQETLDKLQPVGQIQSDEKGWKYTSIKANSDEMFDVDTSDHELNDAKWVTDDELRKMRDNGELTPGFDTTVDDLLGLDGKDEKGSSDNIPNVVDKDEKDSEKKSVDVPEVDPNSKDRSAINVTLDTTNPEGIKTVRGRSKEDWKTAIEGMQNSGKSDNVTQLMQAVGAPFKGDDDADDMADFMDKWQKSARRGDEGRLTVKDGDNSLANDLYKSDTYMGGGSGMNPRIALKDTDAGHAERKKFSDKLNTDLDGKNVDETELNSFLDESLRWLADEGTVKGQDQDPDKFAKLKEMLDGAPVSDSVMFRGLSGPPKMNEDGTFDMQMSSWTGSFDTADKFTSGNSNNKHIIQLTGDHKELSLDHLGGMDESLIKGKFKITKTRKDDKGRTIYEVESVSDTPDADVKSVPDVKPEGNIADDRPPVEKAKDKVTKKDFPLPNGSKIDIGNGFTYFVDENGEHRVGLTNDLENTSVPVKPKPSEIEQRNRPINGGSGPVWVDATNKESFLDSVGNLSRKRTAQGHVTIPSFLETLKKNIDEGKTPDGLSGKSKPLDKSNVPNVSEPAKEGTASAPLDISKWKKIGIAKGSNPGGTYEDENGDRWYVKQSKSDDHAKNEVLATKLYQAAGIKVADLELADVGNGKLGTASRVIEEDKKKSFKGLMSRLRSGKTKDGDGTDAYKLNQGFAVDAWLANWDVTGLVDDNVIFDKHGDPVRVDPGGALTYRAQGQPKGAAFGDKVVELDTFVDPKKSKAAALFDSSADSVKITSARRVAKISEPEIDNMVDSMNFDKPEADELKSTLKARRLDIMDHYHLGAEDADPNIDINDPGADVEPEVVPDAVPEPNSEPVDPFKPSPDGSDSSGANSSPIPKEEWDKISEKLRTATDHYDKNNINPKNDKSSKPDVTPDTSPDDIIPANPKDLSEFDTPAPVALEGEAYPPTRQQNRVINAILQGHDVVVQALAGSGKTSTLEALAKRLKNDKPDSRALYIVFNKSAQTEAKDRMPDNVEPRTQHSLAYTWAPSWMTGRLSKGIVNPDEIGDHLGAPNKLGDNDKGDIARGVLRTVGTYANSADDEIGLQHLPESFNELSPGDKQKMLDLSNKAWLDVNSKDGKLKIQHDFYRKAWALTNPDLSKNKINGKNVDIVFIDEAQDTPPVLAKVIADQKIQKVVVGDENQAIYGFTGAIDFVSTVNIDTELPLTKSWRFGPQIADYGNRFLQMLGAKNRVIGGGSDSTIVPDMQNPDAILVRSNAGMIAEIMEEMNKGRKVGVPINTKGDLKSLIDSARWLKMGGNKPYKMHSDIEAYKSWNDLAKDANKGDNPKAAMIFSLFDKADFGTLSSYINNLIEPSDVKSGNEALDKLQFTDTPNGTKVNSDWNSKFNVWENLKDELKEAGLEYGQTGEVYKKDYKDKKKGDLKPGKAFIATGTPEERKAKIAKAKELILAKYSDENYALTQPDVTVSTAHKAKGLEWDRVKIGDDFKGPKTNETTGETDMPSPEELKLAYVAVTRAKKELDLGSLAYVEDYTNPNGEVDEKNVDTPEVSVPDVGDLLDKTAEKLDDLNVHERSKTSDDDDKYVSEAPDDLDAEVPNIIAEDIGGSEDKEPEVVPAIVNDNGDTEEITPDEVQAIYDEYDAFKPDKSETDVPDSDLADPADYDKMSEDELKDEFVKLYEKHEGMTKAEAESTVHEDYDGDTVENIEYDLKNYRNSKENDVNAPNADAPETTDVPEENDQPNTPEDTTPAVTPDDTTPDSTDVAPDQTPDETDASPDETPTQTDIEPQTKKQIVNSLDDDQLDEYDDLEKDQKAPYISSRQAGDSHDTAIKKATGQVEESFDDKYPDPDGMNNEDLLAKTTELKELYENSKETDVNATAKYIEYLTQSVNNAKKENKSADPNLAAPDKSKYPVAHALATGDYDSKDFSVQQLEDLTQLEMTIKKNYGGMVDASMLVDGKNPTTTNLLKFMVHKDGKSYRFWVNGPEAETEFGIGDWAYQMFDFNKEKGGKLSTPEMKYGKVVSMPTHSQPNIGIWKHDEEGNPLYKVNKETGEFRLDKDGKKIPLIGQYHVGRIHQYKGTNNNGKPLLDFPDGYDPKNPSAPNGSPLNDPSHTPDVTPGTPDAPDSNTPDGSPSSDKIDITSDKAEIAYSNESLQNAMDSQIELASKMSVGSYFSKKENELSFFNLGNGYWMSPLGDDKFSIGVYNKDGDEEELGSSDSLVTLREIMNYHMEQENEKNQKYIDNLKKSINSLPNDSDKINAALQFTDTLPSGTTIKLDNNYSITMSNKTWKINHKDSLVGYALDAEGVKTMLSADKLDKMTQAVGQGINVDTGANLEKLPLASQIAELDHKISDGVGFDFSDFHVENKHSGSGPNIWYLYPKGDTTGVPEAYTDAELKTRISDHIKNVNDPSTKSAMHLLDQRIDEKQDFDFSNYHIEISQDAKGNEVWYVYTKDEPTVALDMYTPDQLRKFILNDLNDKKLAKINNSNESNKYEKDGTLSAGDNVVEIKTGKKFTVKSVNDKHAIVVDSAGKKYNRQFKKLQKQVGHDGGKSVSNGDPDSPWYGKPEPIDAVAPKKPTLEPGNNVIPKDEWLGLASKDYDALPGKTKELKDSDSYEKRYLQVVDHGSMKDLEYLHDNDRISDHTYDFAKYYLDAHYEKYNQDLNDYSESHKKFLADKEAWGLANGHHIIYDQTDMTVGPGMDFTNQNYTKVPKNHVDNWVQKNLTDHQDNLLNTGVITQDMKYAVTEYVGGSTHINAVGYSNNESAPSDTNTFNKIHDMMEVLPPIPEDFVMMRSMPGKSVINPETGKPFPANAPNIAELSGLADKFANRLHTSPAFVGGTPDNIPGYGGQSRSIWYRMKVRKGVKGAYLPGNFKGMENEKELLLQDGLKFYIHGASIEHTPLGDKLIVDVEVLPKDGTIDVDSPDWVDVSKNISPDTNLPNTPTEGIPDVSPTDVSSPDAPTGVV